MGAGLRVRTAGHAAPSIGGAMQDMVVTQKRRTLCGFHQICCTTSGREAIFIFPS
jgi:hypothetical protein